MPFILPADLPTGEPAPAPVGAVAEWSQFSLPAVSLDDLWSLSPAASASTLHLPLLLLATALVLLAVRAVFIRSKGVSVSVAANGEIEKGSYVPVPPSPTKAWFVLGFPALKKQSAPATKSEPQSEMKQVVLDIPVHRPRPQRGSSAGGARPSRALRINAPPAAVFEMQPASMARLIMSRHTHRRPSTPTPRRIPSPTRSPSPPTSSLATSPPSSPTAPSHAASSSSSPADEEPADDA